MATGTPVAAFPVDGPLEVLGVSGSGWQGGVLDEDLQQACYRALAVPRTEARARALDLSWSLAAQLFESNLVSAQKKVDDKSMNIDITAAKKSVKNTVTSLSSNQ